MLLDWSFDDTVFDIVVYHAGSDRFIRVADIQNIQLLVDEKHYLIHVDVKIRQLMPAGKFKIQQFIYFCFSFLIFHDTNIP